LFRKGRTELTSVPEIELPNRTFTIWTYYKGHSQLILRAPHFIDGQSFPTRVDVLFKNVHSVKLPTRDMRGLSVSIADAAAADRIAREIWPAA
jgi:hypothetical protein